MCSLLGQPYNCRMFRVNKAQEYLDHFASDRRHMVKADGTWMAKPPDYHPISTAGNF